MKKKINNIQTIFGIMHNTFALINSNKSRVFLITSHIVAIRVTFERKFIVLEIYVLIICFGYNFDSRNSLPNCIRLIGLINGFIRYVSVKALKPCKLMHQMNRCF